MDEKISSWQFYEEPALRVQEIRFGTDLDEFRIPSSNRCSIKYQNNQFFYQAAEIAGFIFSTKTEKLATAQFYYFRIVFQRVSHLLSLCPFFNK